MSPKRHLPYKNRLRNLGLFTLEKILWRPHSKIPVSEGALQGSWRETLHQDCSDRTRTNVHTLREGQLSLDNRKEFFVVRVVRHWNTSPMKAVDAKSLEVFKQRLDKALNNLVWWQGSLLMTDAGTSWSLRSLTSLNII